MNKYKNDPDYGDYLIEQEKDRRSDALIEQKVIADFWNDIRMTEHRHCSDTVLWYRGQWIGSYEKLRSAQSKAEDMFEKLFNEN